jgi:hypothetical protein
VISGAGESVAGFLRQGDRLLEATCIYMCYRTILGLGCAACRQQSDRQSGKETHCVE